MFVCAVLLPGGALSVGVCGHVYMCYFVRMCVCLRVCVWVVIAPAVCVCVCMCWTGVEVYWGSDRFAWIMHETGPLHLGNIALVCLKMQAPLSGKVSVVLQAAAAAAAAVAAATAAAAAVTQLDLGFKMGFPIFRIPIG